jgi:hypothetical protein
MHLYRLLWQEQNFVYDYFGCLFVIVCVIPRLCRSHSLAQMEDLFTKGRSSLTRDPSIS